MNVNGAAVAGMEWAHGALRYPFLIALCLAFFLPGFFSMPPIDRDEARFAQASRQMLESGDFVNISFQDQPRHKKPAGIYWLQAASASLFGGADAPIWAYRVPSLVGATGAVLLTAWLGTLAFGGAVGLAAAVALAASLVLGVEARMAKTDAMLLLIVVAAQGALARAYLAARDAPPLGLAWIALFWGALGLGILIKGPIVLLVVGATAGALAVADRGAPWLRRLRPKLGAAIMLAVALPWLVAIGIATEGRFFSGSVGGDLWSKLLSGRESHGAPPGYYLASFWLTFWPFSLLAGLAVPWAWARRRAPAVRFCLAWIVPAWLVFELVPTKLPHYTLPLLPAIALIAAAAALEPGDGTARRGGWRWWLPAGLFGLVSLALGLALAGLPWITGDGPRAAVAGAVAGAAALATGAAGLAWARRGRPRAVFAALAGAALVMFAVAYQAVLPALDAIWLSPRIVAAARGASGCARPALAAVGYTEPSLVFLAGTQTVLGDVDAAARHLAADPRCGVTAIDARHEAAFAEVARRAGLTTARLATVAGIDYTHGKAATIYLHGVAR